MEQKVNVIFEYFEGVECETIVVRNQKAETLCFGSASDFIDWLRSNKSIEFGKIAPSAR